MPSVVVTAPEFGNKVGTAGSVASADIEEASTEIVDCSIELMSVATGSLGGALVPPVTSVAPKAAFELCSVDTLTDSPVLAVSPPSDCCGLCAMASDVDMGSIEEEEATVGPDVDLGGLAAACEVFDAAGGTRLDDGAATEAVCVWKVTVGKATVLAGLRAWGGSYSPSQSSAHDFHA